MVDTSNKERNIQYVLRSIGGRNIRFCISYAGSCVPGWKQYYESRGFKKPWQKWFNNPIFHNRSRYDEVLGRYRVWFIFMWHIVEWQQWERGNGNYLRSFKGKGRTVVCPPGGAEGFPYCGQQRRQKESNEIRC